VLARCMLWRKVVTGRDATETPLREEQARAVRDGLSRMLYGRLFEWLIEQMNAQLHADSEALQNHSVEEKAGELEVAAAGVQDRLLGVLDISGFESFQRNSLEQLLINLSNEHLQLQFNDDVFRAELEDCAKEGICLTEPINYADNADCVALIDSRGGILDMLDEEVAMPKASDATFVTKVLRGHANHQRLITPKFAGAARFGICHFAGVVDYTCEGFLEKNADRLPSEDVVGLLSASRLPVLQAVGEALREQLDAKARRRDGRRESLSGGSKTATSRFRISLRALMGKIGAADNHYIRCIKPNSEKLPARFTAPMVREQLLFSGVLEAVRIRQQGFSSRLPFRAFSLRYQCIVAIGQPGARRVRHSPSKTVREECDEELAARALVGQIGEVLAPAAQEGQIVFGKSKVFLRTGAMALLESARARACRAAVSLIQRAMCGASVRRRFGRVRPLVLSIRAAMQRVCLDEDWHRGRLRGALLVRLGTRESAEEALSRLSPLLEGVGDLPFNLGIVYRARVTVSRLGEEVAALRSVHALLEDRSIDSVAMGAALAEVRRLELPSTCEIVGLAERAERVRAQLPLVGMMRELVASGDLSSFPQVMADVERLGLLANREGWIAELEGDRLLSQVLQLEALRKVRSLLHGLSVDAKAMGEALEEASGLGLPKTGDVLELSRRAESVRAQLPLVEALRGITASGDLSPLPQVMAGVERLGLLANREGWIAELEGAELVSEVVALAEAEKIRKEELARRQEELAALMAAQAAAAAEAWRAAEAAAKAEALKAATSARAAELTRAVESAAADLTTFREGKPSSPRGESRPANDSSSIRDVVAQLAAAAERIRGTKLGAELLDITRCLQVEAALLSDTNNAAAFEGLVAQVAGLAERIGSVPLGVQLAEIAASLQEQAIASRSSGASAEAAQDSSMVDTSSWGADELRRTVARLLEERRELCHSLQGALLAAVGSEESLRSECEALRSARHEEIRAARAECEVDVRAARVERDQAIAANAWLQSQLYAEQVAAHSLRTDLAALQTKPGAWKASSCEIQIGGRMMQV